MSVSTGPTLHHDMMESVGLMWRANPLQQDLSTVLNIIID